MKTMILAAGRGERMRPLTDTVPKPLLKVGGQSLIEHHIKALVASGVNELVINHAWLGEQIESSLGEGSKWNVAMNYSPEQEALETAGGIINALHLLGNQPFVVVNGDVWTDYNFSQLINHQLSDKLAHLVMVDNPPQHAEGDFFFADGELYPEALDDSSSKLTFSGIALYHPDFFKDLVAGKRPLAPLLREAIANDKVSAEHYRGHWFDIGTPERLQQINEFVSKLEKE